VRIPKGLAQAIANAPLLSKEKERELLGKAKTGDTGAHQALVLANLRWAWKLALSYRGRGIPFEDLFQLGVLGLMKAVDAYDMKFDVRFTTYSTFRIRQKILLEIERNTKVIQLPPSSNRKRIVNPEVRESIQRILSGTVSLSAMGRSNESMHRRHKNVRVAFSEALRTRDANDPIARSETIAAVRQAVWMLPHREKLVIWLRLREKSLKHIAHLLGITEEAVRKIEIRAKTKLKDFLLKLGFEE